jgi:hypothetical protein
MSKSCSECHWWSRHEAHGPSTFRPCRFPLPDAAADYIREAEGRLYQPPSIELPALMKSGSAGENCPCFHPFIERGGRDIYSLKERT